MSASPGGRNNDQSTHNGKPYQTALILAIGIGLAALLRFSLREFESPDFHNFLEPWYDFIRQHAGLGALKHDFSNYTPFYLYLLVLVVYLFPGLSKVFAVKLISIAFDFLGAYFVYKIVRLKYLEGLIPIFAFFAVLFAPTVFLNSAFWGQSDIIYTTALVACLYFLLTERQILALIAFGLAFAAKLQALFFAPLLLILLLTRKVSWPALLLIPGVYIITILPAWFSSRPLVELLLIYLNQAGYYQKLVSNAPNMYQWLPNEQYDIFYPAGLVLTAAVVFMLVVGVYHSRQKMSNELIVQLATLSVLIMPYVLPKMHDRYFFPADVISIIFAFYFPRYFFVPIVVGLFSLFSYLPFLFGREPIPLTYLAIIMAGIIVILIRHLVDELQNEAIELR